MESLMSKEKECFVCYTRYNLHKHHIFGGANRKKADKDGCWCYLCGYHHNLSNEGVHFNRKLDLRLKMLCQVAWETKYNETREEFIKRYGKSYL